MFCDNCDWEKSLTVHIFEWVRITSHSHHFLPFLYIHIPLNSIWIHIHIHSFEFEFNDDDVHGQWTPPQFFYNCNILFGCSILCRCFCVTTFKFRSARTNWIIACLHHNWTRNWFFVLFSIVIIKTPSKNRCFVRSCIYFFPCESIYVCDFINCSCSFCCSNLIFRLDAMPSFVLIIRIKQFREQNNARALLLRCMPLL